jgi:hypothetical protein
VVLEKKLHIRASRRADVVFASVPSVGIRLNNNDKAETPNDLEKLIHDPAIRAALQI